MIITVIHNDEGDVEEFDSLESFLDTNDIGDLKTTIETLIEMDYKIIFNNDEHKGEQS